MPKALLGAARVDRQRAPSPHWRAQQIGKSPSEKFFKPRLSGHDWPDAVGLWS